jgi:hypothetical protein
VTTAVRVTCWPKKEGLGDAVNVMDWPSRLAKPASAHKDSLITLAMIPHSFRMEPVCFGFTVAGVLA